MTEEKRKEVVNTDVLQAIMKDLFDVFKQIQIKRRRSHSSARKYEPLRSKGVSLND